MGRCSLVVQYCNRTLGAFFGGATFIAFPGLPNPNSRSLYQTPLPFGTFPALGVNTPRATSFRAHTTFTIKARDDGASNEVNKLAMHTVYPVHGWECAFFWHVKESTPVAGTIERARHAIYLPYVRFLGLGI
jgi:hypothetical protein